MIYAGLSIPTPQKKERKKKKRKKEKKRKESDLRMKMKEGYRLCYEGVRCLIKKEVCGTALTERSKNEVDDNIFFIWFVEPLGSGGWTWDLNF